MSFVSLGIIVHWLLVIGIGIRVIMKRPEPGVALAWLLLVTAPALCRRPDLSADRRAPHRSARASGRSSCSSSDYRRLFDTGTEQGVTAVDWLRHSPAAKQLDTLGGNLVGSHAVGGSAFQLFSDTGEMLAMRSPRDIDAAKTSVLMEFYIWAEGGAADVVLDALIAPPGAASRAGCWSTRSAGGRGGRASSRHDCAPPASRSGRRCRLACSAASSAAPTCRLHRKIVVVDGEIAWTGSMNLVDPRFFKADAGVGEWVDAMVRLEGPIVAPLAAIAIGDWRLETDEPIADLVKSAGLHLNPLARHDRHPGRSRAGPARASTASSR